MLLACVAVNFAAGRLIGEPGQGRPQHQRRLLLAAVVVFDLSVLVVWKYGSFGLNQVADVANAFGADFGAVAAIALPVGISFYTFHGLSYVIDVYRGIPAREGTLRTWSSSCSRSWWRARSFGTARWQTNCPPTNAGPDGDFARGSRASRWAVQEGRARRPIAPIADTRSRCPTAGSPPGRLARGVRLHVPDLLRLLRLLGHGRRARQMLGFRLPETSTRRIRPRRSPSSGAAGTCRCRPGFATTCTSRSGGNRGPRRHLLN